MLIPGSLVHYKEYVENPAFNQQRNVTTDNPRYIWRDAGTGYFHSLHTVSTQDGYDVIAVIETLNNTLVFCPIDRITIASAASYAMQVEKYNKKLVEQINLCRKLLHDIDQSFDIAKDHGMNSPLHDQIKKVRKELSK